MPTYEYACADCGHELEAVQSFTDDPLTECPECAGLLRKRFGNVGVVFKGPGFYRTDSRSTDSGSTAASSAAPADTSAAKTSDKPADKAPAKAADKPAAKPAPAASST